MDIEVKKCVWSQNMHRCTKLTAQLYIEDNRSLGGDDSGKFMKG